MLLPTSKDPAKALLGNQEEVISGKYEMHVDKCSDLGRECNSFFNSGSSSYGRRISNTARSSCSLFAARSLLVRDFYPCRAPAAYACGWCEVENQYKWGVAQVRILSHGSLWLAFPSLAFRRRETRCNGDRNWPRSSLYWFFRHLKILCQLRLRPMFQCRWTHQSGGCNSDRNWRRSSI